MRRRDLNSTAASVTLFPFLAVLVCAMGALILLLLVYTSKVRHDARVARGLVAIPAVTPDAEPPTTAPVSVLPIVVDEIPLAPVPELPAALPVDPLSAVRDELQAELARLQSASDQRLVETAEARAALVQLERELDRLQQQLAGPAGPNRGADDPAGDFSARLRQLESERTATQQATQQARAVLTALEADGKRLALQLQQTFAARGTLQEQLQIQRAEAQRAAGQYELLVVDRRRGTTRQPLMIECRDDDLIFQPEGVRLPAEVVLKFPDFANPLLAAVRAIGEYSATGRVMTSAELADRQLSGGMQNNDGTYVLLVVRNSGAQAYYVGQRSLQPLAEGDLGYELVADSVELNFGTPDPQRKAAIEAAIELFWNAGPPGDGSRGRSGGGFGGGDQMASGPVVVPGSSRDRRMPRSVGTLSEPGMQTDEEAAERGRLVAAPAPDEGLPGRRVATLNDSRPDQAAMAQSGSSQPNERRSGQLRAGQLDSSVSNLVLREVPQSVFERPSDPAANTPDAEAPPPAPFDGQLPSAVAAGAAGSKVEELVALPTLPQLKRPPTGETSSLEVDPLPGPQGLSSHWAAASSLGPRRWGSSSSQARIGLEQPVTLIITEGAIHVGQQPALQVPAAVDAQALKVHVLELIDREANRWSRAPEGTYWIPALNITVTPGGQTHLARMTRSFENLGLPVRTQQSFNPQVATVTSPEAALQ